MTNKNVEIIEEELKKIHGEYVFVKAQAIINGKYNGGEDEWKNKFFKPRATTLLSKLNRLDRDRVHSLIWNFLGEIDCQDLINADMGEGEQVDTENTKYLDGLIEEILNLVPQEGITIAEGEIKYTKMKNLDRTHYEILNIGGATFNGIIREAIEEHLGKKGRLIFIEDKIINDKKDRRE